MSCGKLAFGMKGKLRHVAGTVLARPELIALEIAHAGYPRLLLNIILLPCTVWHIGMRPVGKPIEYLLPLVVHRGHFRLQRARCVAQLHALGPSRIWVLSTQFSQFLLFAV